MTKREFVEMLADKYALPKADAEKIVNAFLDSVEDALVSDGKLLVRNFGTFRVSRRKPRDGRNPRTGEPVSIPGTSIPMFKASKELTEMLN